MKVFTIGYEGRTQAQVIDRLKAAGVARLVDVRAIAASRRAGFSKTVLRQSLEAEGIDYVHLRGLGTPKAGRDAAHKGRIAEMHAIYEAHLAEPQAELEFARLKALAAEQPIALLCFEADAAGCHREILARRLAREDGVEIVDL